MISLSEAGDLTLDQPVFIGATDVFPTLREIGFNFFI